MGISEIKDLKGGAFYLALVGLAIAGIIYLGLWGYANNNILGPIIMAIFGLMATFSLFFIGKDLIWTEDSLSAVLTSFFLGFGIWFAIAYFGVQQNITFFGMLTLTQFDLLAQIAPQLPALGNWFISDMTAPVVEELFFLIFLPWAFFSILESFGVKNQMVQILVVIPAIAYTFAFFHTGQAGFPEFMTAAIVFRALQLGIYWGDKKFDIIPGTAIVASFGIGAHMANNLLTTVSLATTWQLLTENIFGLALLGLFLAFVLYFVKNSLLGKKKRRGK